MTDRESEWADVESNPDLERDLGYRPIAVDTVVAEQYGQLLFLPSDDELLEANAFLAADEDVVVELEDHR